MTNKYSGSCGVCGSYVPAKGGIVHKQGRRWVVKHLACAKNGSPSVHTIRFSTGVTMTQNSRGRCEDAPCCGCCS